MIQPAPRPAQPSCSPLQSDSPSLSPSRPQADPELRVTERGGTLPQAGLQRAGLPRSRNPEERTNPPQEARRPRTAPSAPRNPPAPSAHRHPLRLLPALQLQPRRPSPRLTSPHLASAPPALRPLPRSVSRHSRPTAASARAVHPSAPHRPFLHEALRHWSAGAT